MEKINLDFYKNLLTAEEYQNYLESMTITDDAYLKLLASNISADIDNFSNVPVNGQIEVLVNRILNKIRLFFNSDSARSKLELDSIIMLDFIKRYKEIFYELKLILNDVNIDPEKVPELYLCYMALIKIYNNNFNQYESFLKQIQMESKGIDATIPTDKDIVDCSIDFAFVEKRIRELKPDN